MIVAGIGCRRGVGVEEVLAAIDAALAAHGRTRGSLAALATTAFKRDEAAIFAAGREIGVKVVVVETLPLAPSPLSRSPIFVHPAGAPPLALNCQPGGQSGSRSSADLELDTSSLPPQGDGRTPAWLASSPLRSGGEVPSKARRRGGIHGEAPNLGERGTETQKPVNRLTAETPFPSRAAPSAPLPLKRGEEGRPAGAPTLTRSALSVAVAGTPSVSESAALAAAGPDARLLGPRTVLGRVTCAIAASAGP